MPLKGNLRDFSTTQLLNLINLAKKTGTLVIEGPSHGAQMAFRNGRLIHAAMGQEDGNLAAILRKSGKLTDEQVKALTARAATASDKQLGLLLINAGYVNQGDIVNSIRNHMLEVVYRLFTWAEGIFRFESALMPGEDKITVPIDLENVILEGTRRRQQLDQIMEELPNLDLALRWAERAKDKSRNMTLTKEEWRVVSYISPKNTMRMIAKAHTMSEMEIRQIVFSLLQAGLVEVVRAEGAPPPKAPSGRPLPTPNPKQQVSVVNKLIARIRSL